MFLIEHDLDVVAGVPVAVVIKAAGLFEDAGQLHAARASRSRGINQVNTGIGQFGKLFPIVTAINDAGVKEGGVSQFVGRDALPRVLADRQVSPTVAGRFLFGFRRQARRLSYVGSGFLCHARECAPEIRQRQSYRRILTGDR